MHKVASRGRFAQPARTTELLPVHLRLPCLVLSTWWLLAIWFGLPGLVQVQPAHALTVQVRSRTTLSLRVQTLDARGAPTLTVSGQLRDAAGTGVGGAPLRLHVVILGAASQDNQLRAARTAPDAPPRPAALPELVTTSADGSFAASVPLEQPLTAAELHAEVDYAGSDWLGPSHAETLLALDKPTAELRLQSTVADVTTAAPVWPAQVSLRLADGPLAGATVQILVDGVLVESVATDAAGHAAVDLPTQRLGKPGLHRVQAALDAGPGWNAALAQVEVRLLGAVRVVLEQGEGCDSGDWCLTGQLQLDDAEATPVGGAAVVLHAGQQELGRLVSDANGAFAARLRGAVLTDRLPPGPAQLVAHVPAPGPWLHEGWSAPLAIVVPEPPGLGGWPYAAALAGLALAWFGAWLRQRRARKEAADAAEAALAGLPATALHHIGPPAPPSCRLRGQVWHGEHHRPVPAVLYVCDEAGNRLRTLACGANGFDVELTPGSWQVQVELDEHEPLQLPVVLPHDGTWDGCALRPASCRAVVRGHFAAAVRRATGQSLDWGTDTPRGVEPRWAQALRRGHAELRAAVRVVERAMYGPRTNPAAVEEAQRAVQSTEDANRSGGQRG